MFLRSYWWTVLVLILLLPVVSAGGFALWISRQPNIDEKLAVEYWDVFIKLLSALTVTVGGAMLFGKFIDERAEATAIAAKQSSRELALREAEFLRQKLVFDTQRHDRKVKLLSEAKTVAARIVSTTADTASLTRFDELYQADLIGVEKPGGRVEKAMVRFREMHRNEPDAPATALEGLSLELSAAVEEELKESEAALLLQHEQITKLLAPPGS